MVSVRGRSMMGSVRGREHGVSEGKAETVLGYQLWQKNLHFIYFEQKYHLERL